MLKNILNDPKLKLLIGFILLCTSGNEVLESFHAAEIKIGTHHGVMLYSLFEVFKTLPEVFEGIDDINEKNA